MSDQPEQQYSNKRTRAEQDHIDLNHELIGVETGRNARFLTGSSARERERKEELARQSMLAYLLAQDARYAKAYFEVEQLLERAQDAVDRGRDALRLRLETLTLRSEEMRSRAAELEDGTKVFRSARDGKIYTDNGRALSDAQAAAVNIDPLAPTLEQYEAIPKAFEI